MGEIRRRGLGFAAAALLTGFVAYFATDSNKQKNNKSLEPESRPVLQSPLEQTVEPHNKYVLQTKGFWHLPDVKEKAQDSERQNNVAHEPVAQSSQTSTGTTCKRFTPEQIAPYEKFRIEREVCISGEPRPYGVLWIDFEGEKENCEAAAIMDFGRIRNLEKYPITERLLEYLGQTGRAPLKVFMPENSVRLMEENNYLADRVKVALSPKLERFVIPDNSNLVQAVRKKNAVALLSEVQSSPLLTYYPPRIVLVGEEEKELDGRKFREEELACLSSVFSQFGIVRRGDDKPVYATLDVPLDDSQKDDVRGFLDLRRVQGIKDDSPLTGGVVREMAVLGSLPMTVYFMQRAKKLIEELPARQKLVDLIFAPKLTRVYVGPGSKEEEALSVGNPEDLFLLKEREYIFEPPRFIEE